MLKIRSFQPAESEAVRRLFTQAHLNFTPGPELEEEIRRHIQYSLSDDLADISRHYLGSSGNHFWVAEVDGQIKGTVGIQRRADGEAELRPDERSCRQPPSGHRAKDCRGLLPGTGLLAYLSN
jgi:hypothetical protein